MNDNHDNIIDEGVWDAVKGAFDQGTRFKRRLTSFFKKIINTKKFNTQFTGVFCDDDAFKFGKFEKKSVKVEFPDFDKDVSVKHHKKLKNCSALITFSMTLTTDDAFKLLTGHEYDPDPGSNDNAQFDGLMHINNLGKNRVSLSNELGNKVSQCFSMADDIPEKDTEINNFLKSENFSELVLTFRIKITNFTPRQLNDNEKQSWDIAFNLDKSVFDILTEMSGSVYLEMVFNKGGGDAAKLGSYKIGDISFELDAENTIKNSIGFVANLVASAFDKAESITFTPTFQRRSDIGDEEDFGSSSGSNADSKINKINKALHEAKGNISEDIKDNISFEVTYSSSKYTYTIKVSYDETDIAYVTFKES